MASTDTSVPCQKDSCSPACASEFNLESLVGDGETYEKLQKSFLPKGKGRPPDPPMVDSCRILTCVANGLLLADLVQFN